MDVVSFDTDFAESTPEVCAMVEGCMNKHAGGEGKSKEISHGVGCGEVEG